MLLSTSDASQSVQSDALLRFGAIVALAADRYSNLEYSESPVHRDLLTLLDELQTLDGQLGELTSFRDFNFLLTYLAGIAEKENPSSGYSR